MRMDAIHSIFFEKHDFVLFFYYANRGFCVFLPEETGLYTESTVTPLMTATVTPKASVS